MCTPLGKAMRDAPAVVGFLDAQILAKGFHQRGRSLCDPSLVCCVSIDDLVAGHAAPAKQLRERENEIRRQAGADSDRSGQVAIPAPAAEPQFYLTIRPQSP